MSATHTKSSPCTRHSIFLHGWWNKQGLYLHISKPHFTIHLATSSCQLVEASRVPYKLAFNFPMISYDVSPAVNASSGNSTHRSRFAGASMKALDTSAIRRLFRSWLRRVPSGWTELSVAAQLSRSLNASSGGVASNSPSDSLSLNSFQPFCSCSWASDRLLC